VVVKVISSLLDDHELGRRLTRESKRRSKRADGVGAA